MKDHELILKMIEEVDPSDTEKLDEIDARVKCYVLDWGADHTIYTWDDKPFPFWQGSTVQKSLPKYTRSRDALREIRPEGWIFWIKPVYPDVGCEFHVEAFNRKFVDENNNEKELSSYSDSEELAELHAIIQAIAWERENG